jgi:RNA polymerase sigma factor (TIGR02999 family)
MHTLPEGQQVTQLLRAWGEGDGQALDELVPLVERELQQLARLHLQKERQGHTLQAHDLVNEVYVRLLDLRQVQWENRAQFFGMAARLMRHVLVDYARKRNYLKRGGGGAIRVSLVHAVDAGHPQDMEVMVLHDALTALEKFDAQGCQIVEMKFFGGLEVEEIAVLMNLSERTVARKWGNARAWLYREMTSGAKNNA